MLGLSEDLVPSQDRQQALESAGELTRITGALQRLQQQTYAALSQVGC